VVYTPAMITAGRQQDIALAPLSARQRKQIYMHSDIHGNVPSTGTQNVYHPARQQAVAAERASLVNMQPKMEQMRGMPSAADYKATVNQGHWVVTPRAPAGGQVQVHTHSHAEGYAASHSAVARRTSAAATATTGGSTGFHQFHKDADPITVTKAKAYNASSIPKEFLKTDSNCNWMDDRCGFASMRRGHDFHDSRKDMDAGAMKRQEFSSEIFGGERLLHKSTDNPTAELRASSMKDVHHSDSRLDRQVPSHHKEEQEEKRSMSARERTFHNLSSSNGNQFPRNVSSKAVMMTPRRTEITTRKSDSVETENRRRCERNYSDVFFNDPAHVRMTPRGNEKHISRGEPCGTTNCSFLDVSAEIRKRRSDFNSRRGGSPAVDESVQIWPWQPESPRGPPDTPKHKKAHTHEERSCWDTSNLMHANSELSRRQRELHHPDGRPLNRNMSASERKRAELTSGQMREGHGTSKAEWDDGRSSPVPHSPKPSMHSRSCTESPSSRANRGIQIGSPRMRKVESLMSTVVF